MKKIIFVICAIAAILFGGSMDVEAQSLSKEQVAEAIKGMQDQLPAEISPGITITKMGIVDLGQVFEIVVKFDFAKMGISTEEAKAEMDKMTDAELKKMVGGQLQDASERIGYKVRVIFEFPDGTRRIVQ